jgi:hypothetical protein
VLRPIAERRAGLLGWVASSNGGINSLVLASGCCPVRFDLDYFLFSGLESKAADRSVRSTQTKALDASPIHGLLGYGEYKRQSNCAGGKLQIPHFVRDDNLWVGGRGTPPLAQKARSGPPLQLSGTKAGPSPSAALRVRMTKLFGGAVSVGRVWVPSASLRAGSSTTQLLRFAKRLLRSG